MKKPVVILLIILFLVIAPYAGYRAGRSYSENSGIPTAGNGASGDSKESSAIREDEVVYLDNLSVSEITQYMRGKIFQAGGYSFASAWGRLIYFTPQGNEYYLFSSNMDAQSRIRAEYGIWGLEDGFMTTTTLKLIEWIDGHFEESDGSTGSRFHLVGFNEVLTEVHIESSGNFHMFSFISDSFGEEKGFYFDGSEYYYYPYVEDFDALRKGYERYYALFEQSGEEPHIEWITPVESIDVDGMNLISQTDNLYFVADSDAKISLFVRAEKNDDGDFVFDDGQDWLLVMETSLGYFPLFPRARIQLGRIDYTVFNAYSGSAYDIFHVLVTKTQGAGIEMYEAVFDSDEQAFQINPVYQYGNINYMGTSGY